MEPRFGHDFSKVRVHTDSKAAESAAAVNALAYTVGRDMVFATGQYAPASIAGKKVVAHELTHVVQQRKAGAAPFHPASATIITDPAYEREADIQSRLVGRGKAGHRGLDQSAPGTVPAQAIQLLENPTTTSPQARGANVGQQAQGNSDSAATDDEGKLCIRLYLPYISGGQVTWEGISQETLDKHVRLKSEDDLVLFKATANSTDTCDAVYFGPAYGRFILKIPDHCTVTFTSGFKSSACCNLFGAAAAKYRGKTVAPRRGTAEEFGIPNDWEPAKESGAKPVKPLEKPKGTPVEPVKSPEEPRGTPRPIIG
jgi:hypothetical protein